MGLGSWSDNHLEPDDGIIGYDWNGGELYGNEYGYFLDEGFVCEDDLSEYIAHMHEGKISGEHAWMFKL